MATVYFTNRQKGQLVDCLKKYPCISNVTNYLECKFQKFTIE